MRKRGFSLVELVIVVVILAVVSAIAVPRLSSASGNARYNATNAGFRNLSAAMDAYFMDHYAYPPNSGIAELPDGMNGYPHENAFARVPPIGTAWDWNGPGSGINPFGSNLSIHSVTVEDSAEMESRFDDGDPTTGDYRNQSHYLIWPMGF